MKVGIIQSSYIPWRGYFDFINSVDVFVWFDDVKFTRRDWRSRNKIKTAAGPKWLTVPVRFHDESPNIDQTRIDYSQDWRLSHLAQIHAAYRTASFYRDYIETFKAILLQDHETISSLNIALNTWILECLGIRTRTVLASALHARGNKTDRLIDLLVKLGASSYLSGPSAEDYLDAEKFRERNVSLFLKTYEYPEYPQLWGAFEPAVSVLDLLFNVGPKAITYCRSLAPDRLVVGAPSELSTNTAL